MEQITCKERLLKRLGLFGVERRRLGVKVYEIAKAGGKVKAKLVFTRAHNNKMGKCTLLYPNGSELLQFVGTGGVEADSFGGLKKGQDSSQIGGP